MSKSLGNIKSIRELLKKYTPNVIRFYLLSAHYRVPLDLNDNSLNEASSAVERILNCVSMTARLSEQKVKRDNVSNAEQELNSFIDKAVIKFEESMDDDFNTPGAIGAIFELVSSANKFSSEETLSSYGKDILRKVNSTIVKLCGLLGLNVAESKSLEESSALVDGLMNLIIEIRKSARENKDWATADKIRDGLSSIGVKLEDAREGTIWKIAPK